MRTIAADTAGVLRYYWHCHHQVLIERSWAKMSIRRQYIRDTKARNEIPLRLHLFRHAYATTPAQKKAAKLYDTKGIATPLLMRMHKKQCVPNCPWWSSSPRTIFTVYNPWKRRYTTKVSK